MIIIGRTKNNKKGKVHKVWLKCSKYRKFKASGINKRQMSTGKIDYL